MENNGNTEVILFSRYSLTDPRKQEILHWLATSVQDVLVEQQEYAKKVFPKLLSNTPAIYLS
jgi:hypothetical protein